EHHETHHIGGVLEVIEARTGTLIELPVARAAPKAPVPQFGPFSSFNRVSCFTMWTPHPPIPPRCDYLHSAAASYKLGQFLTEPDAELFPLLNTRVQRGDKGPPDASFITLTTTNEAAFRKNQACLDQINAKLYRYPAAVAGLFEPAAFPTEAV